MRPAPRLDRRPRLLRIVRAGANVAAIAGMLACTTAATPAHAAVEVHASIENDHVFVGEPFRLTIQVEGSQQAEAPSLQVPDGLDVRYIGPTTRFASVNGKVSSSVNYSYFLTPRKEGRFSLGPFRVTVDGSVQQTEALEVDVFPRTNAPPAPDAPGGGEALRLVVQPDKTTAYVGERVGLRLDLYVGDVAVDNLHFPVVTAEGFALEAFGQPTRREEVVRHQRWTVLGFRSTLTPLRTGSLDLGPTEMSLEIVEGRRGGHGSIFDQLMGAMRRRPVDVRADPITIEVKPVPTAGRPAGFSGAVGQFDMSATAAPGELTAGDPVTLHVEVRGFGSLDGVDPPRVAANDDRFRVYDPTVSASADGKLTVEQVLIPRDDSVQEVPALRFSFFEPESGTFRTLTSGPFPLTVHAAKSTNAPEVLSSVSATPGKAEIHETLGRDIVYIKERPGALDPTERVTFYRSTWFAGLQALPPLLFAVGVTLDRRRRLRSVDSPSARFQRAGRIAKRELAALASHGTADGFYDRLTAAVARYLGAKLDLPPGAIERASVLARLDRCAAPSAAREVTLRYFDLVEQARYAPGARVASDRIGALDLARELVAALERERRLSDLVKVVAVIALLSLAASRSFADEPAPDTYTIFHDGNAAYRAGDYRGAVREYERLLSAGTESGPLLYNLGNAYFKQGVFGRAILSYERACRLMPRDPDTRTNLALARELAKSPAEGLPSWQRVLFAPAVSLASGELAVLWTALWWGLWAALGASLLGRAGRGAVWTLGVITLCVGASFAFRLWAEEVRDRAVVVASGNAVALFEPSETGKEHYRLPEGALVDIRDSREGWVQVARPDGLRGWLPAEQVESIGR